MDRKQKFDTDKTLSKSSSIPPGLAIIHKACQRLYPTQKNPLQVSSVVKFWLGGPDPLDYISMYLNAGCEATGIPEHWHYISCGLSDLYGDGRLYSLSEESEEDEPVSGFGFELTFRLKREAGQLNAPTWPADLLQSLARYVSSTNNIFVSGDHVSRHKSLNPSQPDSIIRNILTVEDPQLGPLNGSLGSVSFIQLVGICEEELQTAQHWNGRGVLELLRRTSRTTIGTFVYIYLRMLNSFRFFEKKITGKTVN